MPEITNDEMLVKIEACGVCSSDIPPYLDTSIFKTLFPAAPDTNPPERWLKWART